MATATKRVKAEKRTKSSQCVFCEETNRNRANVRTCHGGDIEQRVIDISPPPYSSLDFTITFMFFLLAKQISSNE